MSPLFPEVDKQTSETHGCPEMGTDRVGRAAQHKPPNTRVLPFSGSAGSLHHKSHLEGHFGYFQCPKRVLRGERAEVVEPGSPRLADTEPRVSLIPAVTGSRAPLPG